MKITACRATTCQTGHGPMSRNEIVWRWRSACCHAPLDTAPDGLVCRWCGKPVERVVPEGWEAQGQAATQALIEQFPAEVRDATAQAYYARARGETLTPEQQTRRDACRVIEVHDAGNGEDFEVDAQWLKEAA